MFHSLAPSAFGLLAGLALLAAPAPAKAQYYPPANFGLSFATPNFSLGIGQPVYRPYPVVVPAPVYAPPVYYGPRVVAPVNNSWRGNSYYGHYHNGYNHNGYNHNGYNHNGYNHNSGYGYGPRGGYLRGY